MNCIDTKTTTSSLSLRSMRAASTGPFFDKDGGNSVMTKEKESSFFDNNASVSKKRQPFFSRPFIQTKLSIGRPGDKYEQEADAMADKVIQRLPEKDSSHFPAPVSSLGEVSRQNSLSTLPTSPASKPITNSSQKPQIQGKCAECEAEEKEQIGPDEEPLHLKPILESDIVSPEDESVQRKCVACEKEEKSVQTKQKSEMAPTAPSDLESRLNSKKGNGTPLPRDTRSQMEGAFGTDFSGVRIQTDSHAVQMNRQLGAQAFTQGNSIYFNDGKFNPATTSGKHLLAHELTHVVQQGAALRKKTEDQSENLVQRLCGDENCRDTDPLTPGCPAPNLFLTDPQLEVVRQSVFISSIHPRVLKKGDKGTGVELIQLLLLNQDCSSTIRDGLREEVKKNEYGNLSKAAVRNFQEIHEDANGIPLSADGIVGPATLSAMDIFMGIAPVHPPLAPEGTGECYGKAIHGPGIVRELSISGGQLPMHAPFFPAIRAWELSNFDISKHFLKTEHRNFLRGEVIPALNTMISTQSASAPVQIKVIGEASTTGSDRFNQFLSERRAGCTFQSLLGLGIPEDLIIVNTGFGETLARQRLIDQGSPIFDNVEDRTERKVTIATDIPSGDKECSSADKIRPSGKFIAKIACQSHDSFFVNIGDVSDLSNPTYREFLWVHDDVGEGCRFALNAGPDEFLGVSVPRDMHLAVKNPENPFSYSDFSGLVMLRSLTSTALLSRPSAVGNIFHIGVPGMWTNEDCAEDFEDLLGFMMPRGPVKCGHVPDPPEGESCEKETGPCSEQERQMASSKFVGRMGRLSGDPIEALKRIPQLRKAIDIIEEILSVFGRKALAGGAVITFAAKDPDTPIRRSFVFVGAGLNSSGNTIEGDVAFSDEFNLEEPKQLETGEKGTLLQGSDFSGSAKLTVKGGTNQTSLDITGNDINKSLTFKGMTCNSSKDRVAHGRLLPISNAACDSLFTIGMFDRNCKDEDEECPPSRKLETGRRFLIKTGRATYSSLPIVGKQISDQIGGCGATLSFINIGTEIEEGQWIYREFLFVGKNNACPYVVDQGEFFQNFSLPRFLAMNDGDNPLALSHFVGPTALSPAKILRIENIPPANFLLPGNFLPDSASCASANVEGITIPLGAVECGEPPRPLHFTTPDPSDLDRCLEFKNKNPFINFHILKLALGMYNSLVDSVSSPPGLRYERYNELSRRIGDRINNGIFVGKSSTGDPLITVVDFEVLSIHRNTAFGYVFKVRLLSDPCSYDQFGSPVLLYPKGCKEGFIYNGQETTIFPVIKQPENLPTEKPEESNGQSDEVWITNTRGKEKEEKTV